MGKFYNEKSLQWNKSTNIIKNDILCMYAKKGYMFVKDWNDIYQNAICWDYTLIFCLFIFSEYSTMHLYYFGIHFIIIYETMC